MDATKWLVEHQANPGIIDNFKQTPHDLAKTHGHVKVANYLAKKTGKVPEVRHHLKAVWERFQFSIISILPASTERTIEIEFK